MRKLPFLALSFLLTVVACAEDARSPTGVPDDGSLSPASVNDLYVPGRVLVLFRSGAPAAQIAQAHNATIQREVTLGIRMLEVPHGREVAIATALEGNPNVVFAEPDFIRLFGDLVMPGDLFFGYKWDLHNDGTINSSTGEQLATTGQVDADMDWLEAFNALGQFTGSATLGIMDTGIRESHEDLAGRVVAQYDFYAGDSYAADDHGHGTHVAGIATAYADNDNKGVAGVAYGPNVKLVIAKVCGPTFLGLSYGCATSDVTSGIKWAVDNGAHVLNLSLGGSIGSDSEQQALQYARANNVLPICAAGNEGGAVSYPAAFPECVAVSATDWGDNLASYSNFGAEIELSAPGGDDENANGYSYIASSYYDADNSYALMAGTSMASPQVAGLATLLHALGEADDAAKLARMKNTVDDLGASGWDEKFGEGRINVYRAIGGTPDDGGSASNAAPTASFTYSCTDLTCDFDGSGSSDSDGTISSFDWDLGDGTTLSGETGSHTYDSAGDYPVNLTVTDDDGATDSESQVVSVSSGDGSTDTPPNVSISNPSEGEVMSGTDEVRVAATDYEDAFGTLFVEVRVDGGPWQTATFSSDFYRWTWDTTVQADGEVLVEARGTDSDGNVTDATPVTAVVDNSDASVDDPPTVAITHPADGSSVTGNVTIQVDATDAEDAAGSLTAEVRIGSDGVWQAATWNSGTSRYELGWDTSEVADGTSVAIDARATDSGANTTNAATVGVTVDHPDAGGTITKIVMQVQNKGPNYQVEAEVYAEKGTTITAEFHLNGAPLNQDSASVGGRGYAVLQSDKVQGLSGADTFSIGIISPSSGVITCSVSVSEGSSTCQ